MKCLAVKTNIMLKNWQHNGLLVRGISCYSTVCGFRFPDQSGESSCPWCNLRYVICYTRPFLRSSSSCEQLLYSRLVENFSLRLPGHLPADCLGIRLFVFNLLLLSVWRFFIPTFPEEISVLNVFWNKIVTLVAIYPKQLFIVPCPTFLFSKLVRSLVELWDMLIAWNASQ